MYESSKDTIDHAIIRKKLLVETIQRMQDSIEDCKREIIVLDEIIDIKSHEVKER